MGSQVEEEGEELLLDLFLLQIELQRAPQECAGALVLRVQPVTKAAKLLIVAHLLGMVRANPVLDLGVEQERHESIRMLRDGTSHIAAAGVTLCELEDELPGSRDEPTERLPQCLSIEPGALALHDAIATLLLNRLQRVVALSFTALLSAKRLDTSLERGPEPGPDLFARQRGGVPGDDRRPGEPEPRQALQSLGPQCLARCATIHKHHLHDFEQMTHRAMTKCCMLHGGRKCDEHLHRLEQPRLVVRGDERGGGVEGEGEERRRDGRDGHGHDEPPESVDCRRVLWALMSAPHPQL